MKKVFVLAVLSLLLFTQASSAEPYLTADPQPEATAYRVRLSTDNGTTWGAWTLGPPVQQRLLFDLRPIAPDDYTGEAQAQGTYTVTDSTTGATSSATVWSDSAPFRLTVPPGATGPRGIAVMQQAPGTPGAGN